MLHPDEKPSMAPVTYAEAPLLCVSQLSQATPFHAHLPSFAPCHSQTELTAPAALNCLCPSAHHTIPQICLHRCSSFCLDSVFPSPLFLPFPDPLSFETHPVVFLWFPHLPPLPGLHPHFCCHYNTLCIFLISLGLEEWSVCPLLHDSLLGSSIPPPFSLWEPVLLDSLHSLVPDILQA